MQRERNFERAIEIDMRKSMNVVVVRFYMFLSATQYICQLSLNLLIHDGMKTKKWNNEAASHNYSTCTI